MSWKSLIKEQNSNYNKVSIEDRKIPIQNVMIFMYELALELKITTMKVIKI